MDLIAINVIHILSSHGCHWCHRQTSLHDVNPAETFALAAFCSFNASTSGEGIAQWIGLRENLQENPIFNGKI